MLTINEIIILLQTLFGGISSKREALEVIIGALEDNAEKRSWEDENHDRIADLLVDSMAQIEKLNQEKLHTETQIDRLTKALTLIIENNLAERRLSNWEYLTPEEMAISHRSRALAVTEVRRRTGEGIRDAKARVDDYLDRFNSVHNSDGATH